MNSVLILLTGSSEPNTDALFNKQSFFQQKIRSWDERQATFWLTSEHWKECLNAAKEEHFHVPDQLIHKDIWGFWQISVYTSAQSTYSIALQIAPLFNRHQRSMRHEETPAEMRLDYAPHVGVGDVAAKLRRFHTLPSRMTKWIVGERKLDAICNQKWNCGISPFIETQLA